MNNYLDLDYHDYDDHDYDVHDIIIMTMTRSQGVLRALTSSWQRHKNRKLSG